MRVCRFEVQRPLVKSPDSGGMFRVSAARYSLPKAVQEWRPALLARLALILAASFRVTMGQPIAIGRRTPDASTSGHLSRRSANPQRAVARSRFVVWKRRKEILSAKEVNARRPRTRWSLPISSVLARCRFTCLPIVSADERRVELQRDRRVCRNSFGPSIACSISRLNANFTKASSRLRVDCSKLSPGLFSDSEKSDLP